MHKLMRGLILPGRRRPHMKDENDQRKTRHRRGSHRRRRPCGDLRRRGRYRTERDRRTACLQAPITDAAQRGDTMLVLE